MLLISSKNISARRILRRMRTYMIRRVFSVVKRLLFSSLYFKMQALSLGRAMIVVRLSLSSVHVRPGAEELVSPRCVNQC